MKEIGKMMDLEAKIKEVEDRNAKLNGDLKVFVEQRAEIDRKIGVLREEGIRQQGEYKALKALSEPEKPESEKVN
jgi:predicted  nucleic acid-binding Zn-ribbon protein